VWTERGSPLRVIGEEQRDGVQERLGPELRVALGMRIGEPSIDSALDGLVEAGCRRVVVLPMFPQHSSTTTASVFDAVGEWGRERKDLPSFVFVRGFADHPDYVAALAAQVRRSGFVPGPASPLVVSFHGIPRRTAESGDPYPKECEATTRALVAALGLGEGAWRVVYQSRFGREEWLKPYCFETLAALPKEGIRSVGVLPAAFTTDCLETIDEIGREAKRVFEEAGGDHFVRVECPNATPEALHAFAAIVRDHLPPAFTRA
jgi:ferrochelatase